MKKFVLAVTMLTTLSAISPSFAINSNDGGWRAGQQLAEGKGRGRGSDHWHWKRGDRLPREYRREVYIVRDYGAYRLRPPPRGHRWLRVENRFVLTVISTGVIADMVVVRAPEVDRDVLWRQRYSRAYTIDDDVAYRDCRNGPDPAGVLAGAVVGGLLGRTVAGRGDRTEGTVVGVIAGGAIGAALTNKVECEDRSYMYKVYNDGFNAGRRNANYKWRNPRNNHRGELNVLDYYEDEDDFRCAVYSHAIYIDGRREEARGRACQQPDGSWAIID